MGGPILSEIKTSRNLQISNTLDVAQKISKQNTRALASNFYLEWRILAQEKGEDINPVLYTGAL